jgi:hypothetical protein
MTTTAALYCLGIWMVVAFIAGLACGRIMGMCNRNTWPGEDDR